MTIKKTTQRQGFKTSEFVAYPAHGVGQIVSIEEQEVAGAKLELFVISFIKDKMTLRVPTAKTVTSALIALRIVIDRRATMHDMRSSKCPWFSFLQSVTDVVTGTTIW